jgi:hypothetical protein
MLQEKKINLSGFFKCTFENNELKYEEVKKKYDQFADKYQFLYNIEGEFCCIVRIINNSFEILLY